LGKIVDEEGEEYARLWDFVTKKFFPIWNIKSDGKKNPEQITKFIF